VLRFGSLVLEAWDSFVKEVFPVLVLGASGAVWEVLRDEVKKVQWGMKLAFALRPKCN
jgi:hypothetical protein